VRCGNGRLGRRRDARRRRALPVSSPTIQTFPETTGDAGGIAPDITETVIATNNTCQLTVRFTVDRPLSWRATS